MTLNHDIQPRTPDPFKIVLASVKSQNETTLPNIRSISAKQAVDQANSVGVKHSAMKSIATCLMLALFSFPAWGASPFEIAMKKSRFEDVQSAANYLLVVPEGTGEAKRAPLLKCDPSAEQAQAWMSGPMHAFADVKQAAELKFYEAAPSRYRRRIEKCASSCSCNAFAALLESASDKVKATQVHIENQRLITPLAKKEDQAKSLACAKAYRAFCSGPIQKYLKSEL